MALANTLTSTAKNLSMGKNISVSVDTDVLQRLGSKMAFAMTLVNEQVAKIMDVSLIQECFSYALEVILAQDSGAKASYERVPAFLNDLVKSLNCCYRGVPIRVAALEVPKRPDSYEAFLDLCGTLRIPCEKVLRVNPDVFTDVMSIKTADLNGEVTLVGVSSNVNVDDLILRSMLTVVKEQQDILDSVFGFAEEMYASRDELLRQWAASLPLATRTAS